MKKILTAGQKTELYQILRERFEKYPHRHEGMIWEDVLARIEKRPEKLWSLAEMERSGGEPDVVGREEGSGALIFMDCSAESPRGRRSLCYDDKALAERKEHKPRGSATEMAAAMGIALLSESQYRALLKLGPFDMKTSSWLKTPSDIRERGGAIFGDYRYGKVFIYHNGASSYYAARGFRGWIGV